MFATGKKAVFCSRCAQERAVLSSRTLPHRTLPHRTLPHSALLHRTVPHSAALFEVVCVEDSFQVVCLVLEDAGGETFDCVLYLLEGLRGGVAYDYPLGACYKAAFVRNREAALASVFSLLGAGND